ncbi:Uncharacterized protein APZ42_030696 [Daphnia magna]|uniref:Uncharacterized protein n=1 Tax=Daphnia magna TaxID=35525 RepID=A0A162DCY0_9CRUS|nr:Uncharacterized protein APZ42_030696 [Daphnia magna]
MAEKIKINKTIDDTKKEEEEPGQLSAENTGSLVSFSAWQVLQADFDRFTVFRKTLPLLFATCFSFVCSLLALTQRDFLGFVSLIRLQ